MPINLINWKDLARASSRSCTHTLTHLRANNQHNSRIPMIYLWMDKVESKILQTSAHAYVAYVTKGTSWHPSSLIIATAVIAVCDCQSVTYKNKERNSNLKIKQCVKNNVFIEHQAVVIQTFCTWSTACRRALPLIQSMSSVPLFCCFVFENLLLFLSHLSVYFPFSSFNRYTPHRFTSCPHND